MTDRFRRNVLTLTKAVVLDGRQFGNPKVSAYRINLRSRLRQELIETKLRGYDVRLKDEQFS